WAGLVALLDRGQYRQVQDPDVKDVLVEHGPEDGIHDRRCGCRASPIIDPEVDQVCLGRDADIAAGARGPITRDDPGNGGAMTICVIGADDRGIEIAVDDHSTVEVWMCGDPAVDHG